MKYRLRGCFSTDGIEDVLRSRGVTDIVNFLNPSSACETNWRDLDNINEGLTMLKRHLDSNSNIFIVVDSDVDGITSSTIMYQYIKNVAPNTNIVYSVHDGKRHGLEDIQEIADLYSYDLIIVPDAGSNDFESMEILNEHRIDVLILDHHLCEFEGYSTIPENTVLINNQQSSRFPNKSLCGAGVVYKFCEAYDETYGFDFAKEYVDLVAVGLIADASSRVDVETNYLVMHGLRNIKNECLKKLIEHQSFSLKEKAMPPYYGLTSTDIGFYIAPLLNAIVRVGTFDENMTVVDAFINPNKLVQSTKRGAFKGETETIADSIARLGTNARSRQNRIKEKAIELIDEEIITNDLQNNNIIVVELNKEWQDLIPTSMTGLIAANFVSKYSRPVLLGWKCNDGSIKGSIRGNDNFEALPDLKAFLIDSGYFDYVQGHPNAAGFSIPKKYVKALTKRSNELISENAFTNCYMVDYIIDAEDFDLPSFANTVARNVKFVGNGIPEIKFVIENIPLDKIFVMGKDKDSAKISCNGIDYVKFKDEDFINFANQHKTDNINVLCSFSLNCYAGNTSIQAIIEDYEISNNKYSF